VPHHGALDGVGSPGARAWLAARTGITYTFPEAESAKTRDSVTCTLTISCTGATKEFSNEMLHGAIKGTHLSAQRQRWSSLGCGMTILAEEPVTPLVHVPAPIDADGVRSVYRQVAQCHVLQERRNRRCAYLRCF